MSFDDAKSPQAAFRPFVVGFFDLLGHAEALQGLRTLPDPQNEAQRQEFVRCVKQSVGSVRSFRRTFRQCFDTYRSATPAVPPDAPEHIVAQIRSLRNLELVFQGFGDTVLVFFPTHSEQRGFSTLAVEWLMFTVGVLMAPLLANACPIRGAIEVGIGVELFEGEIHGPVLADAYRLESCVAQSPRVIIGDELWTFLNAAASLASTDPLSGIAAYSARRCLSIVTKDLDGRAVVNFVGHGVREMNPTHSADFDRHVAGAHAFACRETVRFRGVGNEKLARRYEHLKAFIEANSVTKLPASE